MSAARLPHSSSDSKIFQRRIGLTSFPNTPEDKLQRRIFQLSDRVYSEMCSEMKLKNQKLMLHCLESGSYGDVMQVAQCAEIIQRNRPQCELKIVIKRQTKQEKDILAVLPVKQATLYFLSDDYFKMQEELKTFLSAHATIGIPVAVDPSAFTSGVEENDEPFAPFPTHSYTHHRVLREYGFYGHVDTKGNTLSMGLEAIEEGIIIPPVTARPLASLSTQWVRTALSPEPLESKSKEKDSVKLYHMYVHELEAKLLAVTTVAEMEAKNAQTVCVFLPLKDLKELKPLSAYLAERGIGKITCYTDDGKTETVTLREGGKEMRILCGAVPRNEMSILQQHSEHLFGCTGDLSFGESVSLNKAPLYELHGHKTKFFKSFLKIAEELKLERMTAFLTLIDEQDHEVKAIYEKNMPRRRRGFFGGDSTDQDYDEAVRLSIPDIIPKICAAGDKLAKFYEDPNFMREVTAFNRYIAEYCNVTTRLLENVDRAMVLLNYPDLIEVEKNLWKQYKEKKLDFEGVCSELKKSIQAAAKAEAKSSPRV